MKKVIDFIKEHNYLMILLIFIGFSISLSLTYSNFIVTSNNHKAAEMYIGSLKYSMKIDSNETNTLTVEPGETIIDVDVNNLNPVDTYYKLLYLSNSNLTINYYSQTKDTSDTVTKYNKPNDSITSSGTNSIKLSIVNNSSSNQTISFSLKGGYINNTLNDISVPSGYSEINKEDISTNTYFCYTDSTLEQGTTYSDNYFKYAYKQEAIFSTQIMGLVWLNINYNGWGIIINNTSSTDAFNGKMCTYINNSPIVSASYAFFNSKFTSIDTSNMNTKNIVNMSAIFGITSATSINLSNFNTNKVTDMYMMFSNSKATTLDLSNFDTSNVTNMYKMFNDSEVVSLDLSKFNTSNVINMLGMFAGSAVTTLDLSKFNTSNVVNMRSMFAGSAVTTLDLSNFDTSNVTNMRDMFYNSKAMSLDLSSFDTSNVTDMLYMFQNSTNLKTIYVSDTFNIDNVTSSTDMFDSCTSLVGGSGTKYNSSYTDKTYARIDGGTSSPGYFTDVSQKPSTFDTDDWATIVKSVKEGNTRKYKVGDTKTIDMGSYGTHTLRIANTSTPSECSTSGFSQTACGFVLEFADIITTHNMNDTPTNVGGWPASSMRTFTNSDIYNSLPSDLKNGIIDTTVVSSHGSEDTANFTSTDKLYLLASKEIYIDFSFEDTAKDLTRQLDYYANIGVTTSNSSGTIKKNGTEADYWWLRSAFTTFNPALFIIMNSFYGVYSDGSWGYNFASTYKDGGVSPAFRIG